MAQQSQQEQEQQKKQSFLLKAAQTVAEFPSRNMENPPSLGGQGSSAFREALKDLNDTFHQVFFGKQAGPSEMGTPLSPTPQMVTQDLGTAADFQDMLSNYAARGSVHGQQKEQGKEQEKNRDQDRGMEM